MSPEEVLVAVLGASDDAIVVVDEKGQFAAANSAYHRWFGSTGLGDGPDAWIGTAKLYDPYSGRPISLATLQTPGSHLVTLCCDAMPAPIRALLQIRIAVAGEGRVYLFKDVGHHISVNTNAWVTK